MQVEVIQNGRVLRRINHNGTDYIEAPASGNYEIRLTNNSPHRRCAVVTVDGLNINDGKDGSFDGSGYVLAPWQTFTLKGWLRSNSEVAAFEFKPNEGSYANQMGRGTKNTGVIGVAVFDEKPKPVIQPPPVVIREHHHHHHHDHWTWPNPYRGPMWVGTTTTGGTFQGLGATVPVGASYTSNSTGGGDPIGVPDVSEVQCAYTPETASAGAAAAGAVSGTAAPVQQTFAGYGKATVLPASMDLGTGYGQRKSQYTTVVDFERATTTPAFVITMRYAVREKLREWGVPIPEEHVTSSPPAPNPFPAAPGFVQPPPGWGG